MENGFPIHYSIILHDMRTVRGRFSTVREGIVDPEPEVEEENEDFCPSDSSWEPSEGDAGDSDEEISETDERPNRRRRRSSSPSELMNRRQMYCNFLKDLQRTLYKLFGGNMSASPKSPPLVESPQSPPLVESPESPPQLESPESPPQLESPESPPQLESPESPPLLESPDSPPLVESLESPPQLESPESPPHLESPESPPQFESPESPPPPESPESPESPQLEPPEIPQPEAPGLPNDMAGGNHRRRPHRRRRRHSDEEDNEIRGKRRHLDDLSNNNIGQKQDSKTQSEWISIGTGQTKIHKSKYFKEEPEKYSAATRHLLVAVFGREVLSTHSLTGKKSPAHQDKPAKQCLDPIKVGDIIKHVRDAFNVSASVIRLSIFYWIHFGECAGELNLIPPKRTRGVHSISEPQDNRRSATASW
uniref:SFRICE_002171 n=1 Tax=Spodoptera frugiperda TaxID=7108 RepID=A0A2H1W4S7_SPOFR